MHAFKVYLGYAPSAGSLGRVSLMNRVLKLRNTFCAAQESLTLWVLLPLPSHFPECIPPPSLPRFFPWSPSPWSHSSANPLAASSAELPTLSTTQLGG